MNQVLAFSFGLISAILSIVILFRGIVEIVAKFKAGEWAFQFPVRIKSPTFVSWTFHTDYGRKAKDATMRIEVLTDKGIVFLPTHSIVDWLAELQDMQPTGASQQKQGKKNQNTNNQNQKHGQTGSKSQKGLIGKGKTIKQDDKVLLISTNVDLYPNMRIKLSDGTVAQIKGIQLNRKPVQKADAGEHVGIELDVNAIAGTVHKA